MKFKATIHYWKGKSGLAIADVPDNHIPALGGIKQRRVRGTINGVTCRTCGRRGQDALR